MVPSYYSILRTAVLGRTHRLFTGQERGLQECVENLFGQGKLFFGKPRPLRSNLTGINFFLQAGTIFTARSDSAVQRRNLSVVGALSRTFSIPSVSGPSFRVCSYHIDCLLSSPVDRPVSSRFQKAPMSTCGLVTVSYFNNLAQRRGHLKGSSNYDGSTSFCFIGSFDESNKYSLSLRDEGKQTNYLVSRHVTCSVYKRGCNSESCQGSGRKDIQSSSSASASACVFSGTAPDASINDLARVEQLTKSPVSSKQTNPANRTLKLISGSCYMPHPDKEKTGGEDAHFICDDEQAIGVADGVGGWADLGVDSGLFARELMSNSVNAIEEEPKGFVDPSRVLEKAHSSTKSRGSSTACIIALTDKGLHAINLGDSGFMVVRDGCTIFRSPVQQHDFNFTYQLESGNGGDLPSSGQVFSVSVAPGDVIITGTDGLFDNLYNNEVTAVVVNSMRTGLGPQLTAEKIVALARKHAQDKNRQTPFSTAAQDAGYRYYGGKLDDITVVVSYVTSSSSENHSPKRASTSSS